MEDPPLAHSRSSVLAFLLSFADGLRNWLRQAAPSSTRHRNGFAGVFIPPPTAFTASASARLAVEEFLLALPAAVGAADSTHDAAQLSLESFLLHVVVHDATIAALLRTAAKSSVADRGMMQLEGVMPLVPLFLSFFKQVLSAAILESSTTLTTSTCTSIAGAEGDAEPPRDGRSSHERVVLPIAPPSIITASPYYYFSTGCTRLDAALGGAGFCSGWVTEIYGEAGAGKTQLLLQTLLQQAAFDVAAEAVAEADAAASTVDTMPLHLPSGHRGGDADFSSTRSGCSDTAASAARCAIFFIVSEDVPVARLGPLAAAATQRARRRFAAQPSLTAGAVEAVRQALDRHCTVTATLSRLQICHISSLSALHGLLRGNLLYAARRLSGSLNRCLIAVDSIAAAALGESTHSVDVSCDTEDDAASPDRAVVSVGCIATALKQLAVEEQWCILVSNQIRAVPSASRPHGAALKRSRPPSTSTAAIAPALGFQWAVAPHCRVLVRKSLMSGVRQLVSHGSPCSPPRQVSYTITSGGIVDA